MLPGCSSVSRWPVSQSVFRTQSAPLLPCLRQWSTFEYEIQTYRRQCRTLTFAEISQFAYRASGGSFDAISNHIVPHDRVAHEFVV